MEDEALGAFSKGEQHGAQQGVPAVPAVCKQEGLRGETWRQALFPAVGAAQSPAGGHSSPWGSGRGLEKGIGWEDEHLLVEA